MGTIGVFMSIAQNDPHMPARKNALLQGLAKKGLDPTNTTILYAYAFPDLNTLPQYTTQATNLMNQVISSTAPGLKILFASCYPTLTELINNEPPSDDITLTNPIPIVYGGLFHDDETAGNPNQNFGPNIGGVYSHVLKNLCDKWVNLLQAAVPKPLKAIAVTYDNTHAASAQRYVDRIYNATGKKIQPTKININQGVMTLADIDNQLAAFLNTAGIDNTNSGLIVPTAALTANRRQLIIQSANQRGLNAIYPHRMYVECVPPGYQSYGAILLDQYYKAGCMIGKAINAGSLTPKFKTLNTFETCP
jgi:hypothetical protein